MNLNLTFFRQDSPALLLSTCLVLVLAFPGLAMADKIPPQGSLGIRYEATVDRNKGDWLETQSPSWVNIPKAAASFVATEDGTTVAITFSAEAFTQSTGRRLFVRALVDGDPADPADVVFTEGPFTGARSFTFTRVVDQGIHSVEMQWQVDSDEQHRPSMAYMRGASVQVRTGLPMGEGGSILWHTTPPSGPNNHLTSSSWVDIPGAGGEFWVPADSTSELLFSAEAFVFGGNNQRMLVRPIIDQGAIALPSQVRFARTSIRGVKQFVFQLPRLPEGLHDVQMQWFVTSGGNAVMGDKTLVVSSYPSNTNNSSGHRVVTASSAKQTSSSQYETVPGLSDSFKIPNGGEVSVTVSAEVGVSGGGELWMRTNVGGQTIAAEEVVLSGGYFSTRSFVFDRKLTFEGDTFSGISVEWKVVGGGQASIGERTMSVLIEPRTIPDLAEAPAFGGDNVLIEPAIGKRKLLTILWDAHRPEPDDQTPDKVAVWGALFGAHSLKDYYQRNSGDRLRLQNEDVLGWFDAKEDWTHYWTDHPRCEGGSIYVSGHQEKWAEAIDEADAVFDFAAYDTNRDGTLQPSELGIQIIIPQDFDFGTKSTLDPYCTGDPFMVDGVIISELFEWYTSDPQRFFGTAAHELAHLFFDSGDIYIDHYNGNTEPGNLSLMGGNKYTTTHFDPVHKLAMGWVTPVIVEHSGQYQIEDVKLSERVHVLPRRNGGDGREYFILENRQSSVSDPLYDEGIAASGIVLWHVIEDPVQSAFSPNCVDQDEWVNVVSGNARRGIRLMRPGISWGTLTASWQAPYYDLLDEGLVCPSEGDDPTDRRNTLTWADGTPSGYSIFDWPTNSANMTVHIIVD